MLYGPIFVDDLHKDLDPVQEIFDRDYTDRLLPGFEHEDRDPRRKPLSPERSLGSVIKLLTPSPSYKPEYNAWLNAMPPRILALVFMIKRLYRPEWGDAWREHLSVDEVNGAPGHELKVFDRQHRRVLSARRLRPGGHVADLQAAPGLHRRGEGADGGRHHRLGRGPGAAMCNGCAAGVLESGHSVKLAKNCEYRLFQRPDDAIIPGFDKQTKPDMAQPGNFMSNFEPLKGAGPGGGRGGCPDPVDSSPRPCASCLEQAARDGVAVVSSAHPRLVDGKPSQEPALPPDPSGPDRPGGQVRRRGRGPLPPQAAPGHAGVLPRWTRCSPAGATIRRNRGIRPLAVYNPIHYQELPELFMDFICSLTGKSPSTTGAGSARAR